MSNISLLSRVVQGVQRQVDLSTNTLVTLSLIVGGLAGTTLTKAILDRLVSLQNGTDVDTTFHTHNTVYYTQTQLAAHATAAGSGAKLIGDGNTYAHITPASFTVEDALLALDAAVGSATAAVDTTFRIVNFTDATKKIAFSAAGISTGTTRTITMPDSDVNLGLVATAIQASGSVTFTADQSHGGFKITNLANGIGAQDAITLSQAQSLLAGLDWKQHVRAMADSNNTLTGTQTVDGVALIAGDRVLVQNQTASFANGIYVVSASAWSRSSDTNTPAGLVAASVYVDEGTNYKGSAWVQTAPAPITIGTTAITFVKFASILPLVFRNGLTQTGQNIDVTPGDTSLIASTNSLVVNLASGSGLVVSAGVKINLESSNPTLQITSNQLGVKLNPAGAINTGPSGILVVVDNSTIAITTNAVGVKASGISATQLSTGAFDQSTITGGAGTAASVQSAPKVVASEIAGEVLPANALCALRYQRSTDPLFSAGRFQRADQDATSVDNFYVVALTYIGGTAAPAGGAISITRAGVLNAPSHGFTIGAPLYLGVTGVITATAPSTTNQAVVKVGMARDTNNIDVVIQIMGVA